MKTHMCCECGSTNVNILLRKTRLGPFWYVHCNNCGEDGGDYMDLPAAVASCVARPAEARVGGVLRGGYVVEDRFCYHGPTFARVRLWEVKDLRLLEHMTDRELRETPAAGGAQ